jgi:hypothetical protein
MPMVEPARKARSIGESTGTRRTIASAADGHLGRNRSAHHGPGKPHSIRPSYSESEWA